MINRFIIPLLIAGLLASAPAFAESKAMLLEIYRIAPGKHEEFLRHLALLDQANVEAGIPARQLFVHQDGASWDFVLIQPARNTDEQNEKLSAAFKRLGIPGGAKFFVHFRTLIAEHTDTFVEQTTAAEYLKKLE
jgi:hypothetical protein